MMEPIVDSDDNNATMGQEVGALEALVHLTCFHHEGVRKEATLELVF